MTGATITLELFDRNMDATQERTYPDTAKASESGLDWMLGGGGAAYIHLSTADANGQPVQARVLSYTRVGDEIVLHVAMDPPMRAVLYRLDGEEFTYVGV